MKSILLLILTFLISHQKSVVTNSIWVCKINARYSDTLKFNLGSRYQSFSSELNYTFKGTYQIVKDTLILIELNDLQNERFRLKFCIEGDLLRPLKREKWVQNKWAAEKEQMHSKYIFKKIK